MITDAFDLADLEAKLAGSLYAHKLHHVASTGSTNTDAMQAGRSGAPDGSVFFADEQTAGRGRGNHAWHSAAGEGLYVSILLRPQFSSDRLRLLPLIAGLSAAEAVRSACDLQADLRWPNDLLIGSRKTGGILAEAQMDGASIGFAVVGIGINVHQKAFGADLATPATSLDIETGCIVSRQKLLLALLESLEREVAGLLDPDVVRLIPQRVMQASTWVHGRIVEVHGPQACVGVTEGLDENGFLLVRTREGLVQVQTGGIRAWEKD